MLFIQSPNATLNNGNVINGTAGSTLDGAIYLPNGQLTFSGTSGAMTKCAMVVVNQAIFSGTTHLQNNTTGCTADQTVVGKAVRLVG